MLRAVTIGSPAASQAIMPPLRLVARRPWRFRSCGGRGRAAPGSAHDDDLPVRREVGQVIAQLGERKVDGVGDMAGDPLVRFAHIDQHRTLLEGSPGLAGRDRVDTGPTR